MTTVGSIVGGAFALVSRRPGAVLVWALIHVALGVAGLALMIHMLPAMIAAFASIDPAQPEAANPAMMNAMAGFQGVSWLVNLVTYFVGATVLCAAFRATLQPDGGGFASLRLGWDEVRTFLMMMVLAMAAGLVAAIGFLVLFLIGAVIAFVARDVPVVTVLAGLVLFLAGAAAFLYALVRISLIYAVSFIRGKLTIDEAWALTKGRFWTLFLAYVVIMLVVWIATAIVSVPIGVILISALASVGAQGSDPQAVTHFVQAIEGQYPLLGALVILMSALQGVSTALFGGAMATAAQGFLEEDGALEPTGFPEG